MSLHERLFGKRRVTNRHRPRGVGLWLEPLEDRTTPAISGLAGTNSQVFEGQSFSGSVATFFDDDPEATADMYDVQIDWDDGTPTQPDITDGVVEVNPLFPNGFMVTGTHTYSDQGPFAFYFPRVSVKYTTDPDYLPAVTSNITYADAPLAANGMTFDATAGAHFHGTVASFNDADLGASTRLFNVSINWGDGTPVSSGTAVPNGQVGTNAEVGFDVTGSHTYADAGDYRVTVNINDVSSTAHATSSATVSAPPNPELSVDDIGVTEGNSGTTNAVFTVSLSPASTQTVTVHYATADGTATAADNDYLATSGTLTFAPGETAKTVTVQVVGDTRFEDRETFSLVLSDATADATIAKATGTGTVTNDDLNGLADNFLTTIITYDQYTLPHYNAYALGHDHLLYWYRQGDPANPNSISYWDRAGFGQFSSGVLDLVGVNNRSGFYVLGLDHAVYHIDPGIASTQIPNGWPRISDFNMQALVGVADRLYALGTDRTVFQYDFGSGRWVPVTDPATRALFSASLASYDFGPAGSPVAPEYAGVSASTTYSSAAGYGWLSGTIGQADHPASDPLTRDDNFTRDGTFAVDLPNGAYQVTMALGDAGTQAHDRQGVFLEGSLYDVVATAAGQVVTRSYTVVVNDGQLDIRLAGLAGKDPYAVIAGLDIRPTSVNGLIYPVPPDEPLLGASVDVLAAVAQPFNGTLATFTDTDKMPSDVSSFTA